MLPLDVSEPDSKELQEAVSKTTFQHEFSALEPATAYSIYLKAYSPLGASQSSSTLVTTTLGGGTNFSQHYNTFHTIFISIHKGMHRVSDASGFACPYLDSDELLLSKFITVPLEGEVAGLTSALR